MATVGKVTAVLTARTKPFTRSMKRAGKTISDVVKRVVKFGVVMAAAAAVGLAAMVRRQLKLIDSLGKMSRALGIAVVDLQALRLAGQLGGIEINKMDKAIKRIVKSVSDANRGLSTAKDAFEAIGLNAKDLNDLDPWEIFLRMSDAMKKAGVNATTLGALMDLFGARVGTELVNVLLRGRDAINAVKQEVKDLGLELSTIDIIQIEETNDAWTRFKVLLEGVANQITLAISPVIKTLIDRFIDWGKEGVKAGNNINAVISRTLAIIGVGADAVRSWTVVWKFLQLNAASFVETIFRLSLAVNKLIGFEKGAKDAALSLAGAIQATAEAQERFDKSFKELGAGVLADKIKAAYDRIIKTSREAAELAAALAKQAAKDLKKAQGLEAIERRLKVLGERFTAATRTPLEKFKETMEQLKELFSGDFITREVFDRAIKAAREALDRATPKAAAKAATAEREGRAGTGNINRVAIGGTAGSRRAQGQKILERSAKKIEELLKRMADRQDNPEPVLIAWD